MTGSVQSLPQVCQKHFQRPKQNHKGCDIWDHTIFYTSNYTFSNVENIIDLSFDKLDLSVTSKFAWIFQNDSVHYLSKDSDSNRSTCKDNQINSNHLHLLSSIIKKDSGDLIVLADESTTDYELMKYITQVGKNILSTAKSKGNFHDNLSCSSMQTFLYISF